MGKIYRLLLIILSVTGIKAQHSCNSIANYYSDFSGVFGKIDIRHVPVQQVTYIEIHLSVAAKLPGNNDWKVTAINRDIYSDLINDRGISLRFNPVITNPYPIVTAVFVNGDKICSNPPARGSYISTIKLSYTYTLNNLPQNYPISDPSTQRPYVYHTEALSTTYNPPPIRLTRPPQTVLNNKFETSAGSNQQYVCGVRRNRQTVVSFVIGGEKGKNDFPWLAAFYYGENGFICGGSLLSTKIVATAAHCIQDKQNIEKRSTYESSFYLGKYHIRDLNERDYINSGVDNFILHPDWDSFDERYKGDIAIAVLSKVIKFTNSIIPLCIWPQQANHQDLVNTKGLVAGWGITETGTLSDVPNFVSLPVVDDVECLRSKEVFSKITSSSTFCVGDKSGRSPCNGDSGGAFVVQNPTDHKYYFRGIVSSGLKDENAACDPYNYVIFTDAAQYTNWIMNLISTYG